MHNLKYIKINCEMIQVKNLDFSYQKGAKVIDNLSFEVPANSIFGFLGANGSGKTTTIRILLNLCKADKGDITINKHKLNSSFYKEYKNIGTLIESPTFYQQLSGEDNLKILAKYYKVDQLRIDEILETVGLSDSKRMKVKRYSLGMKQRLGIAQSLLHNPRILILDEPVNGLDPRGIKEIRELLFRLKEQGKTIFISSHLLDEIEKTCDYVCIIDKGKKLFTGEVNKLQQQISKSRQYTISCSNAKRTMQLLAESYKIEANIISEQQLSLYLPDSQSVSPIVKSVVEEDIDIYEVVKKANSLEDLFLKLTEK